ALENAMRLRVHFRNVKGASGDAVAAADAIGLLEINDAVGVLHDGTVRGTRRQASGLRAMHDGSLMWLMRKNQCMHCAEPGCMHWFLRISHITFAKKTAR